MQKAFNLAERCYADKQNNIRKSAFTLAEVLITLGIIGVVAAMTMPTLINSTNGAQYKAAYKKALSVISQAVTLNVALEDVSFADVVTGAADSLEPVDNQSETIASLLNKRAKVVSHKGNDANDDYQKQLKANADKRSGTAWQHSTIDTFLFFNDSSMFAFQNATPQGCTLNQYCFGYIDVNGKKGPNQIVLCDNPSDTTYVAPDGENQYPCTVTSPTDVYPVFFYDQTIVPGSNAAKAVLYGK